MVGTDASPRRRVAYLLPVYNEAEGIVAFHRALQEAATSLEAEHDVQFVYVDDGSRDDSVAQLIALREEDPRVVVIGLSRNFGHQKAVTAALDAVDADAVVVMDTDLQDPPAVSLELVERWRAGADVVYAQRRTRNDTWFKRTTADLFYRVLARTSSIEIPRNTGDYRLIDRRVVEELRRYREQNRFLRGLTSYVGFRQEAVLYDRDARYAGKSGYPLRKMVRFAGDGIFGFSTAPLVLISRIGFLFSALSLVGILYALGVRVLTPERAVPGWAFLAIVLLLVGGIQITMLGILGSYLGRVYTEVQRRPLYAVSLRAGSPWHDGTAADRPGAGDASPATHA
jgi:glycosyltransferase involved in cell wall biosynthesis